MALSLPLNVVPFIDSSAKRQSISSTIESYAVGHQAADVGLTIGTCWLPGGGLIAMAGALAIQAPIVYQPMARAIGKVYMVTKFDDAVKDIIEDAVFEGAALDIAGEFGVEFFKEILGELLAEIGAGALFGAIPFLGTAIAAIYDAKIAATLTWRVGLMTAIYYENGCEWLGSRHETYECAKKLMAGGLSSNTKNRIDFSSVFSAVPGLQPRQAKMIVRALRMALDFSGVGQMVDVLTAELRIDPALNEFILREVQSKRIAAGRPSAATVSNYMKCAQCLQLYRNDEPGCPHCELM